MNSFIWSRNYEFVDASANTEKIQLTFPLLHVHASMGDLPPLNSGRDASIAFLGVGM